MSTVLLIDDDSGMRDMIRRMLESAKYDVLDATSGVAGIALFRERRPDVVLTDILMPDKDGVETLREIRKIDPQARVIAMSGGGRAKYTNFLKVAKEFGATETIEKPFRREELLAAVARVLAG
jgi:DNA-binding NtrC family response regulator